MTDRIIAGRHYARKIMGFILLFLGLAVGVAALMPAPSARAQKAPEPAVRYSYADIADLATRAPMVMDGRVAKAVALLPDQAQGVAAGRVRMLIDMDLVSLIRSPAEAPTRITFLADVPRTAKGKPPKLKKQRFILFARPVAGRPERVQLQSADAMLVWSPDTDAQVRAIVREVVAANAPPAISGVTAAYYTAGSLPGEGETQIFLATGTGLPMSLIISRDAQGARWAVAFGELVDATATRPARETLGWYRLACGLPARLPPAVLEGHGDAEAAQMRADYALVLQSVGACARTPGRSVPL